MNDALLCSSRDKCSADRVQGMHKHAHTARRLVSWIDSPSLPLPKIGGVFHADIRHELLQAEINGLPTITSLAR